MEWFSSAIHWLSGGENQYMRLYGCMKGDTFWITLTIALDLTVAAGYVLIARHWWINQRDQPRPAHAAQRAAPPGGPGADAREAVGRRGAEGSAIGDQSQRPHHRQLPRKPARLCQDGHCQRHARVQRLRASAAARRRAR